jgi:hypothetical protein
MMSVWYIADCCADRFVGIVGHRNAIQCQMSNHSESNEGRMVIIVIGDKQCVVLNQIDDNAGHREWKKQSSPVWIWLEQTCNFMYATLPAEPTPHVCIDRKSDHLRVAHRHGDRGVGTFVCSSIRLVTLHQKQRH